ncbi:MAG TPA: pyridine nucleotide-disulfide oxidoreductase [Gammaproteobacteria bacterium]|nr:pyridine nucleotide-disulfide oxidoreductase [Gammaproteobacteria bacterium]
MSKSKLVLLIILAILVASFFIFDLGQYFTLDYLKSEKDHLTNIYQQDKLTTIVTFMLVYIAVTALSLPGAAIMTIAAGVIFGVFEGSIIVSFASTIGATLAFLAARFVLRDSVQRKFGDKLKSIDEGMEREGKFYLFTLRLIPAFPFFMINLLMGITKIKTTEFFWVSQVGMLPGTIVYVNAGDQLASLDSLSGIMSPGLIFSFALLGIFPLLAKKAIEIYKSQAVLKKYQKPENFDFNLVVIGAGSGGLVTAYIAAAVNAKVALIEKDKMGGDCLNTGCVPSKAIIRSAKMLSYARRAKDFGFKNTSVEFEFSDVMSRVHKVIEKIEPHDSVERYTGLGVDVIQGEAMIRSPYEVEVNGKVLTTRNIVIATGARPFVPNLPGLDEVGYLTSDTVWELKEQPKRFLVLGGGPIGCELAQAFQRLGSEVTLVQRASRIMLREDEEISAMVEARFRAEGMNLLLNHSATKCIVEDDQKYLVCDYENQEVKIPFDEIILALGRKPNITGFGLEALGVTLAKSGVVQANPFLQTNFPNIYACGDVAGPYQFTHTAAHQAWYAAVNALFSPFKRFKVDYSVIPWATYTDPEVARVGLNELEAKEQGIEYEVTTYGIDDLDRAIADSEDHGVVKVLTVPGKDKILGVTIAGNHAGDLIAEYVMAMKHGLGLNKILGTIHIYPTMAEANKFAAGNWKKAHKPEKLLAWVKRFHEWRRAS